MEQKSKGKYYSIPQFEEVPFLFHGFAAVDWGEKDFKKIPELREFAILFLRQIHSNIVHCVENIPPEPLRGDALLTALPRLVLIIKTADCLPVLLVEKSAEVIAAVHCGWKGTGKRVIQQAVLRLKEHYGVRPGSLLAAFGPCIGADCYEVGEDVRQLYEAEKLSLDVFRPHTHKRNKSFLDLREANRQQLVSLGVKKENIFSVGFCSHCSKELPSWRRTKDKHSRMMSFIGKLF